MKELEQETKFTEWLKENNLVTNVDIYNYLFDLHRNNRLDGVVIKQTAETIKKLLQLAKREHYYCEDCWYTCPKHPEGCCNDDIGDECNCGADRKNKEIEELELLLNQDSRLAL